MCTAGAQPWSLSKVYLYNTAKGVNGFCKDAQIFVALCNKFAIQGYVRAAGCRISGERNSERRMSIGSFVSSRLSLRGEARGRWAPAIAVAVGGVALSLLVMLLAVAVVCGFKNEIKHKIMGFDAEVAIYPLGGYGAPDDDRATLNSSMQALISAVADDVGAKPRVSLVISTPGMLKTDNDFMGLTFKAFDSSYDWAFERGNLIEGELPDETDPSGIVVSQSVADKLQLHIGDKVGANFFIGETVRPRKFTVKGVYCSNFSEYDNLVAYAPRAQFEKMLRLEPDEGWRIELRDVDEDLITPLAERLQFHLNAAYAASRIPVPYAAVTVFSSGAVYFNWLAMLDTNIVVIMVLMGCVCGFMLVSCVIILILQRIRMIGILKALGATDRQITGIFLRLGCRVTLWGILIGNVAGLGLIAIQKLWHIVPLNPQSYYLSYVPVELSLWHWLILNVSVLVLAFLLMIVPAGIIGRVSPSKVMRFE